MKYKSVKGLFLKKIKKLLRTKRHVHKRNKKGIFVKLYDKNDKCINHPNKKRYCLNLCKNCYDKDYLKYRKKVDERIKDLCKELGFRNKKTLKNWYNKYILNKMKVSKRNAMLKHKYGINSNDYEKLFKKQKGKCAICGKKFKKNLHIDHNHKNNKIRGLLCFRCNYGLGYFKENLRIFNNIVKYLKNGDQ